MGMVLREVRLGVREEVQKGEWEQGRCEGQGAGGSQDGQRETLAVTQECEYLQEGG